MRKSKSETLDTRKRIVSAATRMFLAHGLAETGIASIMAAAGLTQGGFYRHFRSKEQLIVEANIAANDRMCDFFGAVMLARLAAGPEAAGRILLNARQAIRSMLPAPGAERGSKIA